MAILDARYTINGLVDTSKSALDNMTAVVNSCNTWLSYDATEGKWAVVINQSGTSAFSFSDSNILGPINLTSTELTGFYNSVEVRFHNTELRDREDYVVLETPTAQRLPNEPDNRLIINAPLVNNQIQAQLLGLIELKQSRLDKVIQFATDYSYVNIEAGTIISVTNSVYGWTNKLFRVLQISEQEAENTIVIEITAQEYSSDVYDDSDLFEYLRENEDGLIELDPLVDVSPVTASTDVVDSSGDSLLGLLGANALVAAIKALLEDQSTAPQGIYQKTMDTFESDTGTNLQTSTFQTTFQTTVSAATSTAQCNAMAVTALDYNVYNPTNTDNPNNWISAAVAILPAGYDAFEVEVRTPNFNMDYYYLDQDATIRSSQILAQPAFQILLLRGASLGTAVQVQSGTIDWTSNIGKIAISAPAAGTYFVALRLIPTYDLNMYWPRTGSAPNQIFFYDFVQQGGDSSVTQFTASAFTNIT